MPRKKEPLITGVKIRRALTLTAASLVFASGCSKGPERLAVAPVKGQITVEGEPAIGAQVTLHPISGPAFDKNVHPVAQAGPDGSFQFTTYDAGDGAPLGEYAVTVHWRVLEYPNGDGGDPVLGPNLVDKLYGNATTTDWKVTVANGANQLEVKDLPGQVADAPKPVQQYEE